MISQSALRALPISKLDKLARKELEAQEKSKGPELRALEAWREAHAAEPEKFVKGYCPDCGQLVWKKLKVSDAASPYLVRQWFCDDCFPGHRMTEDHNINESCLEL